jgi:hypothetical protein
MGKTWWSIDAFHTKRPQLSHLSWPFILVRKTKTTRMNSNCSPLGGSLKRFNPREPRLLWWMLTHRIPCRLSSENEDDLLAPPIPRRTNSPRKFTNCREETFVPLLSRGAVVIMSRANSPGRYGTLGKLAKSDHARGAYYQ